MASVFTPVQKKPSHQTVLSSAEPSPDLRTETFMQRWRNSAGFKKRMQQLHDGTLPAHKVKIVDARILAMGATRLNKSQSTNYAKRYMQGAPGQQSLVREINNAATLNQDGYNDHEPNEGALDKAYSHIAKLQREGAVFRAQTGLGIGLPVDGRVKLIDDEGHIVVELPKPTALALASDPRVQPSFQLFQMAGRGETPPDIDAAANAALDVIGQDRRSGDALLFKSREDRIDAIRDAFAALRIPDAGENARRLASQKLALALFAEALPHKQAHQMLMDMIPFLGNYRAAEEAKRSGKAALEALERGDKAEAAALMAETLLNVMGVVGGGVTAAFAAGSKSVRATLRRRFTETKTRRAEQDLAETEGVEEVAVKRIEGYVNRKGGTQLDDRGKSSVAAYLTTLPDPIRKRLENRLGRIIGDAAEFYFEPIFQRVRPGIISQAEAARLKAAGLNDEAKTINRLLRKFRDKKWIRPDAELIGYIATKDNKGLWRITRSPDGIQSEPIVINVKAGGQSGTQSRNYDFQADELDPNAIDPPSISAHLNVHFRRDEWKLYVEESLHHHLNEMRSHILAAGLSPSVIKVRLAKALEVADLEKIFEVALVENMFSPLIRPNIPETKSDD